MFYKNLTFEKIARKLSRKIVNNFECIVKTLFVRKLSQEFFCKNSVHSRPRHCVIGAIFFFGARKSASAGAISAQKKNRLDATSRNGVRRPDL